jgi:hypothetical protein
LCQVKEDIFDVKQDLGPNFKSNVVKSLQGGETHHVVRVIKAVDDGEYNGI